MEVWTRCAAVCAAAVLLSGCYGFRTWVEYEHHSSIPAERDLNTVDQYGGCIGYPLSDSRYATEMEVCIHDEIDDSKPVFGPDPVGTIRIKQPIYKRN